MSYVYIAAPFFNKAQCELLEFIEGKLTEHRIPFYSPRRHQNLQDYAKRTKEDLIAIFDADVYAIKNASTILAVTDWAVEDHVRICRVENGSARFRRNLEKKMELEGGANVKISDVKAESYTTLNIPDSGTVFEIGLAYALGKRIFLYTESTISQKLNLMLAACSEGFIVGRENLAKVLQDGCGWKSEGETIVESLDSNGIPQQPGGLLRFEDIISLEDTEIE